MVKLIKNTEMASEITKQIKIGKEGVSEHITFYINSTGNVFVQENDGIEPTDFWVEIEWDDWVEVNKFITQQKKEYEND